MTDPSPAGDLPIHRRGFRYADLTIGVASPELSHLVWLEEFLTPAFEPTAPDEADRWVVLDMDATRYGATLARGPSPAAPPVACFVLDGRTVRHPEWNGSGPGERILFDTNYQTFYRIERRTGHVRILAPARPIPPRATLMRVVREMAMATSRARDGLMIHGAAFATGRRGVVLAGPKHAGKTTLPDGDAGVDEATLHGRADELTSLVPCYDAQLGPDAYGGLPAAEEFIALLAGRRLPAAVADRR